MLDSGDGRSYIGIRINLCDPQEPALGTDIVLQRVKKGIAVFAKVKRLFVIKTRVEAYVIIYALALGATMRGEQYLHQYPGYGGVLLYIAATGAVFLGGAKILDCLKYERAERAAKAVETPAD